MTGSWNFLAKRYIVGSDYRLGGNPRVGGPGLVLLERIGPTLLGFPVYDSNVGLLTCKGGRPTTRRTGIVAD